MNHETVRVRVSSCGVSFWDSGKLVWDDTLGHRQFALVHGAEALLRWFSEWKPLESTDAMTEDSALRERYAKIARIFLDNNILVAEGSPRHRFEESAISAWRPWGRLASAFHFSTRNLAGEAAKSPEDYVAMLAENLKDGPAPRAHRTFADAPVVRLPDWSTANWHERDLVELLYRRRSDREFADTPIPLESAAALLKVSAGIVEIDEESQTVFKTSPSGGGRHPTEVYVCARAIDGVEPGIYHYNPTAHTLERIGGPCGDDDLARIVCEQSWVDNSAMVVFYTAVLDRSMWKYHTARTYRVLHFDVGHLNQTVYLLVTALGLGMTFTSAIRDELVEHVLGLDPAAELVMGCAVIGSKA
jgi:SagB-type dehydrogenase family enzyme